MKDRISIWDADFIPYYVCYTKAGAEQKTIEDCKFLADDFINNVNNAIGAKGFIGCLTVGKCFRYREYPEYKGNRKYNYKPEYKQLMDAIKEYLITDYGFVYKKDELEADDLVRIYKNKFSDKYEPIIVSPDKDILCLEGKHYNPKLNEWVITNKEEAYAYFWKSMITGDVIDNIKGIPGKGKAAAEEIFKDIKCPPARILKYYIEHYGEYKGIEEFQKNYKCLHIEEEWANIEEPILMVLDKEASE